jgi:hypothetical protein
VPQVRNIAPRYLSRLESDRVSKALNKVRNNRLEPVAMITGNAWKLDPYASNGHAISRSCMTKPIGWRSGGG